MLNIEEHDEDWLLDATHNSPIKIHFPNACMIQERKIQCIQCSIRINSPQLSRNTSRRPQDLTRQEPPHKQNDKTRNYVDSHATTPISKYPKPRQPQRQPQYIRFTQPSSDDVQNIRNVVEYDVFSAIRSLPTPPSSTWTGAQASKRKGASVTDFQFEICRPED